MFRISDFNSWRSEFLCFVIGFCVTLRTQISSQASKSIWTIDVLKFSFIAPESEVSFDRKLHVSEKILKMYYSCN